MLNPLFDFLKSLGAPRIAAMGAVSLGLLGFLVWFVMRLSTSPLVPLYTDLTFQDSNAIVGELDSRAIEYDLRQDGAVILVPRDQVLRLRMDLAADGLPSGGGVGYEIFDKGDSLGATSFVQNVNHLRALEGELARSIRTIKGVQAARVHLVLPERQLFARDRTEPSASIVLKSRGMMEMSQIKAIQHLVASAVEDLSPGRVSVVDERGKLLASAESNDAFAMSATLDERRVEIEHHLRNKVEALVASVVGNDRVRVRIAADINTTRTTETADIYDPAGRVVRSTQTREEQNTSSEPVANDGVTVGNELPGANQNGADDGNATQAGNTTEEVVNYEISRTTRTQVQEAGNLRRLSVAVVVDGVYSTGNNGDVVYQERTQQELDRISALVRNAVGYDESRGDSIEVVNLRFADNPVSLAAADEGGFLTFTKEDYFSIAEMVVLLIVGLLVLLLVVRPLVRRILAEQPKPEADKAAQLTDQSADAAAALPAPQAERAPAPKPEFLEAAKAAGSVQAEVMEEVGQIVESNPTEAVNVLRHWIQEAA
ncbi:flagellar basal-body MS-ring/collar protein FliF [Tepidamorphus sp. 3E244]|uniref:flagellar basal-body MS-ring/collar protein FliF n=1 Tax=Tepidamorphus sp. 3E244 TaxID=3385498 RepID=UPI0038FC2F6C